MFGGKFRTWMEAHIVRPRKKNQRQDKENGVLPPGKTILSGSSTLQHSPIDTTTIKSQNNTIHNSDSGSQISRVMLSNGPKTQTSTSTNGTPNGVNGSAGGTSLSSPESAYSTGYSTDGTSPGASFPPEYYINIRTGTHYFQQGPLRPSEKGKLPPPPPPPRNLPPKQVDFSLQSKSPVVLKKEIQQKSFPVGHRRSESCDVGRSPAIFRAPPPPLPPPPPLEEPVSLLSTSSILASPSPSPRQRSRIRTNPWVGTNSPVGTASSTSSQKYAEESTESCSSSGLKKHTKVTIEKSSSSSSSNHPARKFGDESGSGSCSSRNGTKLKVSHNKVSILAACKERKSPSIRSPNPSITWSPRRVIVNISGSSSSGSHRSSDDDLTLHEMMGKYDESYVYERETDILSDSDPTDCEECGDTDADTGQDGGDEQDPDDLDFIDKDSYLELNNLSDTERGPRRIGHSTYYHFPNELSRRLSRHRENSRRSNNNSRKSSSKSRVPRRRRTRENNTPGSRSLGGTPVSHRRKHHNQVSEIRSHHQSPSKLSMQRTIVIENSHMDSSKRRSNSVSYVSRRSVQEVHAVPNGKYLANFDSEIALIEADKEADKKYKELILEAEHILVSMKANTPILGSPRRIMNNPPANKRVEILRNTEIDLLPKPRSIDSTPGNSKPCSPRFSPKKNHITNFIQMNSPELSRREQKLHINENVYHSPKKVTMSSPIMQRNVMPRNCEIRPIKALAVVPSSPVRKFNTLGNPGSIPGSPLLQTNGRSFIHHSPMVNHKSSQTTSPVHFIGSDSDESTEKESSIRENTPTRNSPNYISESLKKDILDRFSGKIDSRSCDSGSLIGGTSSSSEGDTEQKPGVKKKDTKRPPLMTFRSVDMGNRVPNSSYCPQSEPVKRKVYSCSNTFDKLQKSLDKYHLIRQRSDGESSATDDHDLIKLLKNSDECRNGLREKVARLRNERIEMEERIKQQNDILEQQQGQFQRLFKRQMLLQTIEGLKRSLEDQSASLKQTYQSSDVDSKNIQSY